ncbi:MAG: mannose-1-phosphate guanylyltransferase/mannose-6-phosphate isomerase [Rhodospirillales bacterium CG15_BIG_FIL_POST_REV_8_21_14_020_66_15]|nr:MAG: mannose-1-phosphate guanylyltransferase/mannose-6-phosphate isomerase [Rhodospirillales bacterium CG15_BIG_FIL_POST_REV_8_21_14_020_66_15]
MNLPVASQLRCADPGANVYPVILCGGSGRRLWPMSRQAYPKQFLRLYSGQSLLQETVLRARKLMGSARPFMLCSEAHKFLVADHLKEIDVEPLTIVCEPASRNTAPALAVAALILREIDPEAIILAMPSDHRIADEDDFVRTIANATSVAEDGWLTTLGITPTASETGYGYIRVGGPVDGNYSIRRVARFEEKPNKARAEKLLEGGEHLWNSGIFLFPVGKLLDEMRRTAPEVVDACLDALAKATCTQDYVMLDRAYARSPDISVDHAVLEHTEGAAVVKADMGWSDIGSWHALRETQGADADGNVVDGNVIVDDVSNSYIKANGRLVAAIGLRDVVVVDTDDAVLVSSADHIGRLGAMVSRINAAGFPEASQHSLVHRPWGSYQTIDDGTRYQVKHIFVKPGGRLSLQMHHHRAEHWVVVGGTARVTCGDETRLLRENESLHIPMGTTHRLDNPGKIPLHLIEVQVGPYLGEDDIVRFEDTYGRI